MKHTRGVVSLNTEAVLVRLSSGLNMGLLKLTLKAVAVAKC